MNEAINVPTIDVQQILIDALSVDYDVLCYVDQTAEYDAACTRAFSEMTREALSNMDDAVNARVAAAIDRAFALGWKLRGQL